jgi:hypothetical protein
MPDIMGYRGRHRPAAVQPVPYEEAASLHFNAVDADGNRYTTHRFGFEGQWWKGATILTASVVERLRRDGKLPLQQVIIHDFGR